MKKVLIMTAAAMMGLLAATGAMAHHTDAGPVPILAVDAGAEHVADICTEGTVVLPDAAFDADVVSPVEVAVVGFKAEQSRNSARSSSARIAAVNLKSASMPRTGYVDDVRPHQLI